MSESVDFGNRSSRAAPVRGQNMINKRKEQAQNLFDKYRGNKEAMMILLENLKKQDMLDTNNDRLNKLSKMDNSYVRYPIQDVYQGSLLSENQQNSLKTASAMNVRLDHNNNQIQ